MPPPTVSVVVPVFNEEGAAAPLAREIADALAAWSPEILFVDDASTDGTRASLAALRTELPSMRVVSHSLNAGQSRALQTGVRAATGEIIVTLDGDGQNIPADAPALLARLVEAGPNDLVSGRRARRRDSAAKRAASLIANGVRKRLLDDEADDTGCGLKAIRRETFLALPYFDHMHRFLPALVRRAGGDVVFVDVGHRPRGSGRSKYNNWDRALVALPDLVGVMWLRRRARPTGPVTEPL